MGSTKQEKVKKRRIELLKFQKKEAAERREWSKKNGGDMCGDTDDRDSEVLEKKVSNSPEMRKGRVTQCSYGSTAHSRSTYRDSNVLRINVVCDKGDFVYTAKDQDTDDADTPTMFSDDELFFSDSSLEEDYLEDSRIYDDEPECTFCAESSLPLLVKAQRFDPYTSSNFDSF